MITIGQCGENTACSHLVERGYKILSRNYRRPWGELDIAAKAKDGTLVFVEVKTLTGGLANGLSPEDHLTKAKLKKLQKICQSFAAANPELIDEKRGWRLDLIAISLSVSPSGERQFEITHYENIH